MADPNTTKLPDADYAEFDACLALLSQLTDLLRKQASGAISLPGPTLTDAFSLGAALLDRAEQVLTPIVPPPGPTPPAGPGRAQETQADATAPRLADENNPDWH